MMVMPQAQAQYHLTSRSRSSMMNWKSESAIYVFIVAVASTYVKVLLLRYIYACIMRKLI